MVRKDKDRWLNSEYRSKRKIQNIIKADLL